MFVANNIVETSVKGMKCKHRPPSGGRSASLEICRPFVKRTKTLFNNRYNVPVRRDRFRSQSVEVKFVQQYAIALANSCTLDSTVCLRLNGCAFSSASLLFAVWRHNARRGVMRCDLFGTKEAGNRLVAERLRLASY